MSDYKIMNPGKPDENTPANPCTEVPGTQWRVGTVEPDRSVQEVCFHDEGQHDEITTIDCSRYGSDYEPRPLLPRRSDMPPVGPYPSPSRPGSK